MDGVEEADVSPTGGDLSLAGLLVFGEGPRPDRVTVPPAALEAAREIDSSTVRRRATPVRKSFLRSDTDLPTALTRVYRSGGRGGQVVLKLYLALLWRCSSPPFETSKPARAWATLIGLEDPSGNGQRRVNAALRTLQDAKLIQVTYTPGVGNTVSLLDESGDGTPYRLPSTEYAKAAKGPAGEAQRRRNTYFKVPSRLWTEGDIQSLNGPGLVMLLILLAEQADTVDSVWFATDLFPARYRISHNVRAQGTTELQRRGLLEVSREALPEVPGSVFARRRFRNKYRLTLPGGSTELILPNPPAAAPDPAVAANPAAAADPPATAGPAAATTTAADLQGETAS